MSIFKKKIYKKLGTSSHSFKHKNPSDEEVKIRVCPVCREVITGKIYYCPACKEYYNVECVVSSVGGCTCPVCEDITFLKTVVLMHKHKEKQL